MSERALMEAMPWLLAAGPLIGVTVVYLLPVLPWRLIIAGLLAAVIVLEVL